jgi:molybdenum cofactor cytidylyltransferase
MQLIKALRYSRPSNVAFVGAGGKTTALFKAARELLDAHDIGANKDEIGGDSVLVTTSTHFGAWQASYADQVLLVNSSDDITTLDKEFLKGVVLLIGDQYGDRLGGLEPKLLESLFRHSVKLKIPLLIEADGSHTLPLKAPADHEPAIPDFIEQVVVVAGLSGLGKPLTNEWVHRLDRFGELTGLQPGDTITGSALVKMLLSSEGGLKNIPVNAQKTALLNQADTPFLQSQAMLICKDLLPKYNRAIIASLSRGIAEKITDRIQKPEEINDLHAVIEQIGAIILAAGGSSRFGRPKQLLVWKGMPLIRHVAINALKAGLSPVTVVVGSSADEVQAVINDLPVRIANNTDWMNGMSSSVKAGIAPLLQEVGGAVFLQADQPQIPPLLIRSLVEAHQASLSPIVAPQIDGQRGNPILFDAVTFGDLLTIEGDIGGRAIFSRYPVEWVYWHDANLLMDIDSPEDYLNFQRAYPENEVQL